MQIRRLILIVLVLGLLIPTWTITAQDDDGAPPVQDPQCDPTILENWLIERQAWRNASQDVLDAEGMSISNARTYLHQHLKAIEDLERPDCADSAMLWTYYMYNNLQYLLTCAQNGDSECVQEMQARLTNYRETDVLNVDALGMSIGFESEQYVNARPEGWTMGPAQATQPAPVSTPITGGAPTAVPPPVDDGPDLPVQPPDPLAFAGPQTQQIGPITDEDFGETYNVEVTIQSARFITEGESAEYAEDGYAILILDVSITNLGPDLLAYIGPDNFQIQDSFGEVLDSIYVDETDACELDYIELEAGQNVTACVAFEVPVIGSLEALYTFDPYEEYGPEQYARFVLR